MKHQRENRETKRLKPFNFRKGIFQGKDFRKFRQAMAVEMDSLTITLIVLFGILWIFASGCIIGVLMGRTVFASSEPPLVDETTVCTTTTTTTIASTTTTTLESTTTTKEETTTTEEETTEKETTTTTTESTTMKPLTTTTVSSHIITTPPTTVSTTTTTVATATTVASPVSDGDSSVTTTTTTKQPQLTLLGNFRGTYYRGNGDPCRGGSGRTLINCNVGNGEVKGSVACRYIYANYGYSVNGRTKVYIEVPSYPSMTGWYYVDDCCASYSVIDFYYNNYSTCPFRNDGVISCKLYI